MLTGARLWVGLAVSAVCLYLVGRGLDWGATAASLAQANYVYLAPALVAFFVGVWFKAVRWGVLLAPIRPIPAARLFPIVVIGYTANNVLPARMGEVARALVFGRREAISATSTLGTIAVERIFDGIAMLSFMASIAVVAPFPAELQQIAWAAALVFVILTGAFLLAAFYSEVGTRLMRAAFRVLPGAIGRKGGDLVERFLEGLRSMRSPRLLAATYGWSLFAWLWEAGMYWLVGLGFGLDLPPHVYLLTVAAANLATLVPSSPGYVGPFDAAAIFVLTLFGATQSAAVGYTLVLHVVLLLPITLLGFYYLWRDQLSLRDVSQGPASVAARRG